MSVSRRTFLGAAAAAAATAVQISCAGGAAPKPSLSVGSLIGRADPNAGRETGKVKITDVKTASIRLGKYDTQMVKVYTHVGLHGLGETYPVWSRNSCGLALVELQ
jgi:hypothetical protein